MTRSHLAIRSDDVSVLTDSGREAMRAYGVRTVIDLRSPSERNGTFDPRFPRPVATLIKADGVDYLHHALLGDEGLSRVGEASGMFERYLMMLDTRGEAFRDIFTSIARAEGAVLFHCFAGKDRTGLVAAMLLALSEVEAVEIAADFGETDVQLAAMYEQWIADAPEEMRTAMRDELRCPPERIIGVLAHVENKWGGVAGYLEASGMRPAEIDLLSQKLA